MNKLLLLLKTYGKIYLGSIARRGNKKETISGGTIVLVIGLVFMVMFTSMSITTIEQFLELDPPEPIYALYVLTSTGIIFMLLIVVLKGTNFKKSNDHDLLLSLPLSKTTIVLSKILKDYLFDLIALLLIMMPGYVCYYYLVEEATFLVVINGLIVIILLTFLSNAVAILMNFIIAKFTRKLKNAEIIQTLVSVFITLIFIVFYFIFNVSLTNSPDFVDIFVNLYPIQLVVDVIANTNFISYLILFAICLVPFGLAVMLEVYDFNHQNKSHTNNNKELVFKNKNVFFSLFKNESSRYFRSTIYVLNTIIGSFFILLTAGLLVGFGKERLESMIVTFMPNAEDFINNLNVIIVLVLMLVSGTVITTSASVSIEGKHLWILKVHPVDEKTVFASKIFLNMLLGGIPSIIASIIVSFSIGFSYLPFLLILTLTNCLYASMIGLISNLKHYKLDWKDEQEIVKQGMAVLIAMGLAVVPGVILVIAYFAGLMNILNPLIYLSLACVVMIIIDVLLIKYLLTKGVKRFKEIN
ncbi:MAG: hypothetical protein IJB21_00265 [Bacilli bacterium]|nr:hypothetical protein [Bacilli bacterium]